VRKCCRELLTLGASGTCIDVVQAKPGRIGRTSSLGPDCQYLDRGQQVPGPSTVNVTVSAVMLLSMSRPEDEVLVSSVSIRVLKALK